jgi:hypothetical protein
LLPGDGIVITDDPADPPVTGFARYILTADPIPQAGYTVMDLLRIDTLGSQTPPPVGTRVRIVAAFATSQFDAVQKSGDTMTGPLAFGSDARIAGGLGMLFVQNIAGDALARLAVANPTDPVDAATKGYVDSRGGHFNGTTDTEGKISFSVGMNPSWCVVNCLDPGNAGYRATVVGISGSTVTANVRNPDGSAYVSGVTDIYYVCGI